MGKILNYLSRHLSGFFFSYIALILVIVGGFLYIDWDTKPVCRSNYSFINPEPVCEVSEQEDLESLTGMKNSVDEYVKSMEGTDGISDISVFYRDLVTRRWFGVNENDDFSPASILKLPMAIAFMKLSEVDKSILNKQFLYKENTTSSDNQVFKPPYVLEIGKYYSANDLIFRMLAYSDNEAISPVADFLNINFLSQVFTDLGIILPVNLNNAGNVKNVEFVSTKTYAGIFRALYNASYLNRENSEKVLGILTQSTFNKGLVAGIPDKSIEVAHKFGERTSVGSGGATERQLHDCGIVYKPDNPYILCVMTKGDDYDSLEEVIQNISRNIYDRN